MVFKKLKLGTGSPENDRISTTSDKEIRLCSMVLFICVLNSTSLCLKFFPFLCTILYVCNSFLISAQPFPSAILSFSLHNYSHWFPLFSWSIFELQIMFFSASIQRKQLVLTVPAMEGQKGATSSSNYWKVISGIIRISIRIFWFPISFYVIVGNPKLNPRLVCFVS